MHSGLNRLGPNNRFTSAVFQPSQPLPEATHDPIPRIQIDEAAAEQEPATLAAVLGRLIQLKPKSPELQTRLAMLAEQLASLVTEADELESECRAERQGLLQRQHRDVREQGKKQQAECARLAVEFNRANSAWNRLSEERAHAIDAVKSAEHARQHLSRFASDKEISAADSTITEAKVNAREALDAESAALNERNAKENELSDARAKLADIAMHEERLRGELSGRPFRDPEYGLLTG